MENGDLDAATLEELRRLARSRPRSGRAALAKAGAIRTLERLARGNKGAELPPCPPDWHPGPPESRPSWRLRSWIGSTSRSIPRCGSAGSATFTEAAGDGLGGVQAQGQAERVEGLAIVADPAEGPAAEDTVEVPALRRRAPVEGMPEARIGVAMGRTPEPETGLLPDVRRPVLGAGRAPSPD
jgi:hypothetical protein